MKNITLALVVVFLLSACLNNKKDSREIFDKATKAYNLTDYQKAEKYFKKACDLDNKLACSKLASMYEDGIHIKQNFNLAIKYYKRACDLKEASSCFLLGEFYEYDGNGLDKDYEKSLKYYKRACDLGNNLGCIHFEKLLN